MPSKHAIYRVSVRWVQRSLEGGAVLNVAKKKHIGLSGRNDLEQARMFDGC